MRKKRKTKRIKIELQTPASKNLQDAEITNYLSRLFSYSYKLESIHNFSKEISKTEHSSNLIIFNQSFSYDHSYRNLRNSQLTENKIYSLLNIGLPFSLEPNEYIFRLRSSYVFLNRLYDAKKGDVKVGFRRTWFWNNFRNFLSNDFIETIEKYQNHEIIKKASTASKNSIKRLAEEIKTNYLLEKPAYSIRRKKKEKNSFKTTKTFLNLVNNLHRHIFAKLDENKIVFLNLDLIKKNHPNSRLVHLRQLTHENPWRILVEGTGVLLRHFLESEKRNLDNILLQAKISNEEKEAALKDLKILQEVLSTLDKLNSNNPNLPKTYHDTIKDLALIQLEKTSKDINRRASQINQETPVKMINGSIIDIEV